VLSGLELSSVDIRDYDLIRIRGGVGK
jgi:hypothetical protein